MIYVLKLEYALNAHLARILWVIGRKGMKWNNQLVIYLYLGRRHVKDYRMIYNNRSVSLITNR